MSSNDVAIRVRNISKHYLIFERPEDRLKQMVVPRLQRLVGRQQRSYFTDFAALKGISFDVKRGETVGIIGRNGCGKSTLLQVVCGILQPSSGTIEVNGRVAALLELGAGFNPDFTGRENVYINAAILGLSRAETERRFDSIASFADIGMFIDQPIKTYSSGMYVRLAFAVATSVDPDVLVIDEALAVGDEAFQRKCFARIEDIKDRGGTVLFVSHNGQSIVQLCDGAMLLDRGQIILEGQPSKVVSQYQRLMNLNGDEAEPVRDEILAMDGWSGETPTPNSKSAAGKSGVSAKHVNGSSAILDDDRASYDPHIKSPSRVEYESKGARICDIRVVTAEGREVNVLVSGRRYIYEYTVHFESMIRNVGFGMMIKSLQGLEIGGGATDFKKDLVLETAEAGTSYRVRFDLRWPLNPGTYFLNAGVTGSTGENHDYAHRQLDAYAVRILPVAEAVATGYVDFDARPDYELLRS
ncbi:ABC transporter ATP-binding protein [Hoeflea poritis]|uniref:ABC transporter ATP-binding protein n=1 Tax=Hoeflea poritis TaxID=2993659 RepID=A0ABT4VPD7_9HYPH|nr:ABC transporter ATP-binding protein [Hoeflea poritis]MDA4846556.1 ABC transporter ATP-binding protein [Hoeflea poritis]